MTAPLMPKATSVWLVENTSLTFDQIATFCQLHPLEVQAIADSETAVGMIGFNPITSGQLTLDEIKRCEADPKQLERSHRRRRLRHQEQPRGAGIDRSGRGA